MIIAGLRYTVNSHKAVQGCKHIVKPALVACKPEPNNGDSTMMNALAVQQGTNGIYWVVIFSMKLNRLTWY